jgi:hypothetical protein
VLTILRKCSGFQPISAAFLMGSLGPSSHAVSSVPLQSAKSIIFQPGRAKRRQRRKTLPG